MGKWAIVRIVCLTIFGLLAGSLWGFVEGLDRWWDFQGKLPFADAYLIGSRGALGAAIVGGGQWLYETVARRRRQQRNLG